MIPNIHDRPGSVLVRSASATDVGNMRESNEDSVLEAAPVYLVADGMGGHEAGEVASAIAVEEFGRLGGEGDLTIEHLGQALAAAARRIHDIGEGAAHAAGTTVALVATMVIDEVGYWVVLNLGDSRVYRVSEDLFEQVSVDHSVVQELVERGELTPDQARVHPYRNMITRALGAGPDSDPDYWLIPAEVGDLMLICSDGLSGEVPDETIERVLREDSSPRQKCDALIDLALSAGGHDNVSVLVMEAIEVVGGTERTNGAATAVTPATPDEDTIPGGAG